MPESSRTFHLHLPYRIWVGSNAKELQRYLVFSLHKYTGQPKIPKECSVFNLKSMLFTCFTARDLKALLALSQHSAWLYRVIKPKKTFPFLFIIVMVCCFSIDSNECLLANGGCETNCHNTNGSYYCSCNYGFELYDTFKCRGKIWGIYCSVWH